MQCASFLTWTLPSPLGLGMMHTIYLYLYLYLYIFVPLISACQRSGLTQPLSPPPFSLLVSLCLRHFPAYVDESKRLHIVLRDAHADALVECRRMIRARTAATATGGGGGSVESLATEVQRGMQVRIEGLCLSPHPTATALLFSYSNENHNENRL